MDVIQQYKYIKAEAWKSHLWRDSSSYETRRDNIAGYLQGAVIEHEYADSGKQNRDPAGGFQ